MPPRFAAAVGPRVTAVPPVRRRLERWLGPHVGPGAVRDDVVLVAAELATNAARAASRRVVLAVTVDGTEVRVAVRDDGPGLPATARALLDASAPPADEPWRGLPLVAALTDGVTVATGPDGTLVRCRRRRD